jgi:RNA methyltransferase, TrmH family
VPGTNLEMVEPAIITSRRHALVKELAAIRDDRDSPLMFLEGPRLVQEVLETGQDIEILLWTPVGEKESIFKDTVVRAKRKVQVSESVFRAISDVESPQGILAIARCPEWKWSDLVGRTPAPIVILAGLQDPGNVAAIVRSAEAAGAAGLVTTPGTAHLFSPKSLRGAMGSTLRLPCLEHIAIKDILTNLRAASYGIAASTLPNAGRATVAFTKMDWGKPWAILMGREGQGIAFAWEEYVKAFVHIPMKAPVESLNVAVAASIILYEVFRQQGGNA